MTDAAGPERERERGRAERLLLGRDPTLVRQHLRAVAVLLVAQAAFTTLFWALEPYGVPERSVVAFAATLVLAGVAGALVAGYRTGGVLVGAAFVLAALAGLVPVVSLGPGFTDERVGTALVVAGFGVWTGALAAVVGAGVRRLLRA